MHRNVDDDEEDLMKCLNNFQNLTLEVVEVGIVISRRDPAARERLVDVCPEPKDSKGPGRSLSSSNFWNQLGTAKLNLAKTNYAVAVPPTTPGPMEPPQFVAPPRPKTPLDAWQQPAGVTIRDPLAVPKSKGSR